MFVHQAIPNGAPQNGAQVSVATGTATAIVATAPAVLAKSGVIVQAIAANTVKCYVGGTGVTTSTGIELAPGDSAFIPTGNPALIYAISGSSGQKLQYIWI